MLKQEVTQILQGQSENCYVCKILYTQKTKLINLAAFPTVKFISHSNVY